MGVRVSLCECVCVCLWECGVFGGDGNMCSSRANVLIRRRDDVGVDDVDDDGDGGGGGGGGGGQWASPPN